MRKYKFKRLKGALSYPYEASWSSTPLELHDAEVLVGWCVRVGVHGWSLRLPREVTCAGHDRHAGGPRAERLRSGRVERGAQRSAGARLYINFVLHVYGGTQPCARPLTRGIPETPRMPNAAPHVCALSERPLVRGRVWRHPGARARDSCVPPSVGKTEPTPPRGASPMSRSRLMTPGHRTARGGHTPERDVGPAGLPRSALQSRPMRG
jgi:hypothetical protein